MADLPLCEVAKCQLYKVTKMAIPCPLSDTTIDFQLYDTAGPKLAIIAGSQPALTIVTGFKSFENTKAGHLIKLVKIQAIIRREAKKVVHNEYPLVAEIAPGLLDLILKSQGTDPLYIRLKKN